MKTLLSKTQFDAVNDYLSSINNEIEHIKEHYLYAQFQCNDRQFAEIYFCYKRTNYECNSNGYLVVCGTLFRNTISHIEYKLYSIYDNAFKSAIEWVR